MREMAGNPGDDDTSLSTPIPGVLGFAGRIPARVKKLLKSYHRAELLMQEFSKLGQKLSAATTAIDAARTIVKSAQKLFPCDGCSLDLYFPETDKIHPLLTTDLVDGKLVEVSPFAHQALSGDRPTPRMRKAIGEGGQLILRDRHDTTSQGVAFGDTTHLSASIMIVPVRHGAKVTGIFFIHSYTFNAYSREDLEALQALADHCGGALQRIWAQEALQQSEAQLRALAVRLQKAKEEEAIRIAREIHDELGQAMTGLKLDLQWLEKKIVASGKTISPEPVIGKIQDMVKVTDQTIKTVRRICSELRPGILDDLGLLPAIEWQASEFQRRTGIACELSLPRKAVEMDQSRATAVFRIVQELLTNISRHAKANRVHIHIEKNKGALSIEVRDNGVGISDERISGTKSLGLLGMRERALLFGGEIHMARGKPRGTIARVKIPLKVAQNESADS